LIVQYEIKKKDLLEGGLKVPSQCSFVRMFPHDYDLDRMIVEVDYVGLDETTNLLPTRPVMFLAHTAYVTSTNMFKRVTQYPRPTTLWFSFWNPELRSVRYTHDFQRALCGDL
jgi:hypothetical protein